MLVLISQGYSTKKQEIDALVGKPFNLEQRKLLGKTSSSNNRITGASIEIHNLLTLNQDQSTCTIEMRPKGIIVSFRSNLETYALVIPDYKLKIYKGKAEEYSFHKDQYFLKIWADKSDPEIHKFIKQISHNRSENAPTRIEDML